MPQAYSSFAYTKLMTDFARSRVHFVPLIYTDMQVRFRMPHLFTVNEQIEILTGRPRHSVHGDGRGEDCSSLARLAKWAALITSETV
jgi:hypothetical protein